MENNDTGAINEIYAGDITIVDGSSNPLTSTWIVPRLDTPVDDTARHLLISCEANSGRARNLIIKFKYNNNVINGLVTITLNTSIYDYWHDQLGKSSEFYPSGEIRLTINPDLPGNYIKNWPISKDSGQSFSTNSIGKEDNISSGSVEFKFFNKSQLQVGTTFTLGGGMTCFNMNLTIDDVYNHSGFLVINIGEKVFNTYVNDAEITTSDGSLFKENIKYVQVRIASVGLYTASEVFSELSDSYKRYSTEWAWSDFIEVSNY